MARLSPFEVSRRSLLEIGCRLLSIELRLWYLEVSAVVLRSSLESLEWLDRLSLDPFLLLDLEVPEELLLATDFELDEYSEDE